VKSGEHFDPDIQERTRRTGTGSVQVTDDVTHTGLVSHQSSKVDRLAGVVLREGLDLSPVTSGTLPGQEPMIRHKM
jgi:hypothetical protein